MAVTIEVVNLSEIQSLVRQADAILKGDPDESNAALWRLVDAAGLLAQTLRYDTCGREPTGRGFQVIGPNL